MTTQSPSTTNITFFTAQTSNATSTGFVFIFPMKRACIKFGGTWNGANITFQTSVPWSTSATVPIYNLSGTALTFTADGQITLENVVYGDKIFCTIAASGGSTSLNVTAQVI